MNKIEHEMYEEMSLSKKNDEKEIKSKISELSSNHKEAQKIIEQVVISAAGWSFIEPWATKVIENIKSGILVDLKELRENIEKWKSG